jgi:membrane protein implicated in regulation of membrane protease activity
VPDQATRYRRRRLAALVLAAIAVVSLAGSVQYLSALGGRGDPRAPVDARPAQVSGAPVDVVEGQVYVVQPGDTLWTIAADLAPGGDLRPVVDRLRAANGDATLEPGQRLVLDID